jgi:hypothetical protein
MRAIPKPHPRTTHRRFSVGTFSNSTPPVITHQPSHTSHHTARHQLRTRAAQGLPPSTKALGSKDFATGPAASQVAPDAGVPARGSPAKWRYRHATSTAGPATFSLVTPARHPVSPGGAPALSLHRPQLASAQSARSAKPGNSARSRRRNRRSRAHRGKLGT